MITILGFHKPRWWKKLTVARAARKDARRGLDSASHIAVQREIGRKVDFDPINNPTHKRLQAASEPHAQLASWTKERDAAEKQLTQHPKLAYLDLGILAAFIVEVCGDLWLLYLLGIDGVQRIIMSLGFAATLFFFTKLITAREAKAGKRWYSYVFIAAYAALVISVAVVNINNVAGDEDASRAYQIASAIVLCFTVIGPAVLSKHLFALRSPVAILTRDVQRLNRKLRDAEAKQKAAERAIDRIQRFSDWWTQEDGVLTPAYDIAYRNHQRPNPYRSVS